MSVCGTLHTARVMFDVEAGEGQVHTYDEKMGVKYTNME